MTSSHGPPQKGMGKRLDLRSVEEGVYIILSSMIMNLRIEISSDTAEETRRKSFQKGSYRDALIYFFKKLIEADGKHINRFEITTTPAHINRFCDPGLSRSLSRSVYIYVPHNKVRETLSTTIPPIIAHFESINPTLFGYIKHTIDYLASLVKERS